MGAAASIDKETAKPENIVISVDKGGSLFGPNLIDFEMESGGGRAWVGLSPFMSPAIGM